MSKKYHRDHPTISFRCQSRDEYDQIKKMIAWSGKSESTFIREILLGAEKQESKSYKSGYDEGFNEFSLPCPFCGKPMIFDIVNNQEIK